MRPRRVLRRMLEIGMLAALTFLLAGCGRGEGTVTPGAGRTLEDFAFLELGMTPEQVTDIIGPPDRVVGSGVTGYSYDLADGSRISLNFGPSGRTLDRVLLIKPDGSREVILGEE
ncbi:MAG TPA: hypothetical protein VJJ46_10640 [Anaerolineales bacterium]|nr:hypothetical protein [Anaerolineales bacterium]